MSQDFDMHAGDDKTLVVSVRDTEGSPVDVTGATVRWRAARSANKTADIIKKTGGSGITLSDPTQGEITITLNAADTDSLKGTFYHECQVTFASGLLSTVVAGKMTILPALIRSSAS